MDIKISTADGEYYRNRLVTNRGKQVEEVKGKTFLEVFNNLKKRKNIVYPKGIFELLIGDGMQIVRRFRCYYKPSVKILCKTKNK